MKLEKWQIDNLEKYGNTVLSLDQQKRLRTYHNELDHIASVVKKLGYKDVEVRKVKQINDDRVKHNFIIIDVRGRRNGRKEI